MVKTMTDESMKTTAEHIIVKKVASLDIFPNPKPSSREGVIVTPNRYINEVADKVIERFSEITKDFVIDVVDLCEKLGGKVTVDQFFSFNEEIRISEEDSSFVITLPNSTTLARDRFTVAHELGHYLMHYILPVLAGEEPFAYRFFRRESDRFEQQANCFAGSLTMPKRAFKTKFEEEHARRSEEFELINNLSEHFGVSTVAIQVRMRVLNLA